MRDKLGWAASNPGIASAQARLSGDQEVQSMMELLNRAHLIGGEAMQAHGLGAPAPITGPPDLSGDNLFEKSFVDAPRSESPTHMEADNVSVGFSLIGVYNIFMLGGAMLLHTLFAAAVKDAVKRRLCSSNAYTEGITRKCSRNCSDMSIWRSH